MKKILIFVFVNFLYFCYSEHFEIIEKDTILIKYFISHNEKQYLVEDKNKFIMFKNIRNSNILVEIYTKINFEKLISIKSESLSYFEISYNSKTNDVLLNNVFGELEINTNNSFYSVFLKIGDVRVTNFSSSYNIISYPDSNFFINVIEGKIGVKKDKKSIILIAGESLEINKKDFNISEIPDVETGRIILRNKVFANYNKIKDSINKDLNFYLRNEKDKNEQFNFLIIENDFLKLLIDGKNIE
ncbi:MAG: hypothetical protein A2086_09715 [Spirochaetes bacterium GWD1_27_9]|nr:MAG: hypothetical protein A2Z98_15830 [Spirochaetes bacterium GWB1_27_13]OHD20440.1 MAG: hypothetical protein A2Y34_02025 [Spirochaetes bacterium GWC1_27_15]OHD32020.1 MAG: hypothetical protein A2086_09715 [Spirochaetes bacterium GWD1_27_9]